MQISMCQSYFNKLGEELPIRVGLFDSDKIIIASTDPAIIGKTYGKPPVSDCKTYSISPEFQDIMFFVEKGEQSDSEIKLVASVICASLLSILNIHTANSDGEYFIKQLICEEATDVPARARILKIPDEAQRVVFVIKISTKHTEEALNIIKNLSVGSKDFLFENKAGELVYVRTCKSEPSPSKLNTVAKEISEVLVSDAYEFASIGIGMVVNNLEGIAQSYKSAVNALDIGEIFVNKHKIYAYSNLGISRLISSIPIGKCKAFLNEVLDESMLNDIDNETLYTIQKFLDYDLNISLAARELYIHRNTLVYRLDRLQKQTGLDVRKFDDALLFKMAVLIHKYLGATRR